MVNIGRVQVPLVGPDTREGTYVSLRKAITLYSDPKRVTKTRNSAPRVIVMTSNHLTEVRLTKEEARNHRNGNLKSEP